jgi:tRNA (adenine37-N6)-methyltransferase
MQVNLTPIGTVHTSATDADIRAESSGIEGELDLFPEYAPALGGVDGYSHLFLVCYFHRLRPDQRGPLQVKPRRLTRRGFKLEDLPLLGVLALDSPTRPNPIGLTLVHLLGREGTTLKVAGLDVFDGTPILDIKGYQSDYIAAEFSMPDWYTSLMDDTGHI